MLYYARSTIADTGNVLATADEAVAWVNEFIEKTALATGEYEDLDGRGHAAAKLYRKRNG